MFWLVLAPALLFIYWIYDIYYNSNQYRLGKHLPGYKPWPIIGSAHLFSRDAEEAHKFLVTTGELCSQNDGVYTLWLGPHLFTHLTNVNDAEQVLNKCLDKADEYEYFNEVMGAGLITLLDTAKWKRHRKIMQPTFSIQTMNTFIDKMHLNSASLVKVLESEVGKGKVDVLETLGTSILDTILATLMDTEAEEPYEDVFGMTPTQFESKLNTMAINRMLQFWLWCDTIFYRTAQGKTYQKFRTIVHSFTTKMFLRKREAIENDGDSQKEFSGKFYISSQKTMFLNTMMTHRPQKLTDNEIIEEMKTLIIAGFDTTSVTLSFVLMLVGSHPEVQNKIYEELASIYQGSNRPVVKEDLAKMTYLEYAIKEVLRLYPPAPMFGRAITTDLKLRNCTLPAGSSAYVMAWTIHRDENIWGPDASEFKPERWKTDKRHPCAFIPFSYGARNCIGLLYAMMTLKISLANILRNFQINADMSDLKIGLGIVIKPLNGCRIELVKRNH